MVHTFTLDGVYIAVDGGTGAVHLLDEVSYEVIGRFQSASKQQIVEALAGKFAQAEVEEVYEEVQGLQQAGQLFATLPEEDIELNGQKVIKSMCLHIAHDCNMRCAYCFAGTGAFHGGRCLMPLEVGKKALDFLMERSGARKNLEVDFFGGEPLMNFDVVRALVDYGRELERRHGKTIHFTITTNGLAMDDGMIEYFAREMHNVVISLDGRKEVHDRLRPLPGGKGSFDTILPRAQALARNRQAKGLDYYVRGTYTRYNLDFTQDVLSLADQGFEQISVEPVVTDPKMPYSLLEEHLPRIKEEYEKLMRVMLEQRKAGRWFNFFHFMIDLEHGPCAIKRLTGCGAGNEYVAITPQGDIYPCHQFVGEERWRMGNVLQGTFDTALQEPFRRNHVLNKEKCHDCWARFFCSGGCAANAWHQNGDISKPYDMECQIERKRVECALTLQALEGGL